MKVMIIPAQILALNLASQIYEQLHQPRLLRVDRGGAYFVAGGILREKTQTPQPIACTFVIGADWMKRMPCVACSEPWCTREIDWHMYSDGSMCLDHSDRWQQYINELSQTKRPDEVLSVACEWLLNATASLLGRHRLKYQGVIKVWDRSWAFWPHRTVGSAADRMFVPAECARSTTAAR